MKVLLSILTIAAFASISFGQHAEAIESGNKFKAAGNNAAAIEAYSKAIATAPDSAAGYVERGELLARTQRCPEALTDLTKALEIDRTLYRAMVPRAYCLGATGKFDEAVAQATQAIDLDPTKPLAYYVRGKALYAAHKHHESLPDLNRAIEFGMNTADAYGTRGNALDATDDWIGAITDHTRAIELDPKNWRRYASRALSRRSYGDYIGSISDYDKTLELAPNERAQTFNRSWAKLFNNDPAGAYQDVLEYLGNDGVANPASPTPSIVAYIALRKLGKVRAAQTFVRDALKYAKAGEWATDYLRFLAGDLTGEKLLERAKGDSQRSTDAHALIGMKFLLDGEERNAAIHFEWDQKHGSHDRIYHQLARVEFVRMSGDPIHLSPPQPKP